MSYSLKKGPVWFEGREGEGRGRREGKGRREFNIILFGLIRKGKGREGRGRI